ncbi:MAG: dephospho-CoA kinase [Bacteroidales bacterium]|nr:dephospho-CoA kinase [Bacteroidales bacterium]
MIKVGITGGIGSGKSLVCQVFSKLGAPIYDADSAARRLSESDPGIRYNLTALLGSDIYSGRVLNRTKMSALIFNDKSLLEKVNQIIHPKVAGDFLLWCSDKTHHAYVIQESAILFESKAYLMFDKYVTVISPEDIRIQRILSRNQMTLEKIRAIINNQLTDPEKTVRSHYVIDNDGIKPILPQILRLHRELKNID